MRNLVRFFVPKGLWKISIIFFDSVAFCTKYKSIIKYIQIEFLSQRVSNF